MKKIATDLIINGQSIPVAEQPHEYAALHAAKDAITMFMCKLVQTPLAEGVQAEADIKVTLRCTMNRRAPKRAPDVIAAEKAVKDKERQARIAEHKRQEAERAELRKAARRRISNQIDHAFASGQESGSEPVAKFITCDTCHAPADFLYLNTPRAKGAVALDESAITNGVCALHNGAMNQWQRQYYYSHVAEVVPCSLLEFLYTGVRMIAIKTGVPA